ALLFALAHLQWNAYGITYYGACGVILGSLYWRRGLWASIAAHAAFNGSLVLLAVVVALGPTHLLSANGVSVRARSDWHVVDTSAAGAPDAVFAAQGPSGAGFVVQRHVLPAGTLFSLDRVASNVDSGQVSLPPGSSIDGSARTIEYPAGRAVQVAITVKGHSGVVVFLSRGGDVWEVDIATEGSPRAAHEYPDLLRTLVLPAA
ncbi:MAG: CPBP family intramembrane metalloprotease, partial [Acidimicrobiia bacterium]|nr:CPBP family intramembrane metalloprotease [Acidimicrobiia bacterium]